MHPRIIWTLKMSALAGLAALVFVAGMATSASSQAPSSRRHVMLPGRTGDLPFSDGVLVGNTFYLAGKLGVDPATGRVPDDIEAEIRFLLEAIKRTLGEAGMNMDHLVFVQVYCPDLNLYGKFNEVYRRYFGKNFPARAFIGSGPLLRGAHFEVQGIAVR